MTTALAWIAILTLIVSLTSTVVAIWLRLPPKDDLLRLTEILLSWEVLAAGLAIGGASTFREGIERLMERNKKES